MDSKLERIFSKDFSTYIVSDGQMKLILKHKCTFIWCFNTPFCVILQYPQSKKNLCQKEKQYSFKLHDYCSYFMSDGHFNRLIIYQNGITMNISNTSSVTVLSNFQFNLFFSMSKKGCKNKYICSSDLCLPHIITFSRISLYYLSHGRFFCLIGNCKLPQCSYNLMKLENKYIVRSFE